MTAFGMGYTALSVDTNPAVAEGPFALPANSAAATQFGEFTNRLLTFIPGDIVGGYTLVAAATAAAGPKVAWIVAIAFTLLAPFVVYWGLATRARREDVTPPPVATRWFRLLAAPLSFAAWVFALPGGPVDSLGVQWQWIRVVVLVVTAIGIAALAGRFDPATQVA